MGALTIADLTPMAGEPRVRDARLGEVLGFSAPRLVRRVIKTNREEILSHGSLHQTDAMVVIGSGARRAVEEYHLNEAQALLVCMFARTEKAAAVRKQVIEVFLAWRRGEIVADDRRPDEVLERLQRLERRLDVLDRLGAALERLNAGQSLALTHVVEMWAPVCSGRRPKWWADVELRSFLMMRHRQAKLDDVRADAVERFGETRTPSRSAIHRFWKALDRLSAAHPSREVH